MLLSRLVEFENARKAQQEVVGAVGLPFMYQMQAVRWLVRLDREGRLLSPPSPMSDGLGKKKDLGKVIAAPSIVRAAGIKAKLLMDNAEYALGLVRKEGDKKVADRHAAFKRLVQECAEATGNEAVRAIHAFLSAHDPSAFELPDGFSPDANVTFEVDGALPIESGDVQRFWAARFRGEEVGAAPPTPDEPGDLINGAGGKLMDREPVKIKGIPGGQTAGMNYVSANAGAFESYGLEASRIAPITVENAEKYANALNFLLRDEKTSLRIGTVVYVFWTPTGETPPVKQALNQPQDLSVPLDLSAFAETEFASRSPEARFRGTLTGLFTGTKGDLTENTPLYGAGFSASGSRVVLRRHMHTTVGEAAARIAAFYANQTLQPITDKDAGLYGVYDLARSMYPKPKPGERVEVRAADASAVLAHALDGQPLPFAFLQRLAGRNRAEQNVTRRRAALAKLVLISRKESDMTRLEALNEARPEAAYHLGRLLAVLDDIQRSVMPGANTTLVDRFYGSMSTTPHAVIGRLIQGAQPHLARLRKDRPGAYAGKQAALESVMARIDDILPKPLDLREQALFSLGYYHQKARISADIKARKEQSDQKKAAQGGQDE